MKYCKSLSVGFPLPPFLALKKHSMKSLFEHKTREGTALLETRRHVLTSAERMREPLLGGQAVGDLACGPSDCCSLCPDTALLSQGLCSDCFPALTLVL